MVAGVDVRVSWERLSATSHQPISALRAVIDVQQDESMSRYDVVVVLVVVGVIVALLVILLLLVAQND